MKLATNGYIHYLRNPSLHTNRATSYPGWGATREAAEAAACYYANQAPWCVTVRADDAPQWAREEIESRRQQDAELDRDFAAEDNAARKRT